EAARLVDPRDAVHVIGCDDGAAGDEHVRAADVGVHDHERHRLVEDCPGATVRARNAASARRVLGACGSSRSTGGSQLVIAATPAPKATGGRTTRAQGSPAAARSCCAAYTASS